MKVINAGYEFITPIKGDVILKRIEECGRVCYKSENKINTDSAKQFCKNIIKRGHEAVLEHCSFTVKFIVDRGVSHEIVRHRIASYCQESTRYCNYSKDKFGNEITVIKPSFINPNTNEYDLWYQSCKYAEDTYFKMLNNGLSPQEARSVLPNSLKTEVVMTANIREWRNFFKLRTSSAAHPQMTEVTIPLLKDLKKKIPILFDDIFYLDSKNIPKETIKENEYCEDKLNHMVSCDGCHDKHCKVTNNVKVKPSKQGCIALIVGASGSGKTTVVEELEKLRGLKSVQSYTTRPSRSKDEKGHIFISSLDFYKNANIAHKSESVQINGKKLINQDTVKGTYNNDPIVAYTYYNNHHYFATQSQVDTSDLYVIDPAGVETLKANYQGNKKIITIYLDVAENIRAMRMLSRGDGYMKTFERLQNDEKIFKDIKADYVIEADKNINDVVEEIDNILKRELNK